MIVSYRSVSEGDDKGLCEIQVFQTVCNLEFYRDRRGGRLTPQFTGE